MECHGNERTITSLLGPGFDILAGMKQREQLKRPRRGRSSILFIMYGDEK